MGKKIYHESCVSCHGEDGSANTNMQLIVKPRSLNKTLLYPEQMYLIIKDGARYWGAKSDIMPAFKYVYNEEQMRAVTEYIVKTFNPQAKKRVDELYAKSEPLDKAKMGKMLKRGKKIFKRNCSWCHGKKGYGDGLATKNPVDSIFPYNLTKTLLDEKQTFLYIKYGGRYWGAFKDDMPSWKKKYDDWTINSVVRYVYEVLRKEK